MTRRLRAVLAGALLAAAGTNASSMDGGASLAGAQFEYYDVEGRDAGSLLASANAHSGGFHGTGSWYLSYQFRTRSVPGGCGVGDLTTKLDLKVRLPRWSPPPDAAPGLVASWQRYLSALSVHEAGHLQTGRDFETAFKRAAAGITAADCGSVGTALRARFDSLLEQARQRDRDYDARTNHGATQGAVFR